MKKLVLLIFILFCETLFSQNGKVGININEPSTTLDINGDLRVRNIEKNINTSKILVADTYGKVYYRDYISNSLVREKILINQSRWVYLNGTVVYGRLLLNKNVTINPSSTNVRSSDVGSADNQLRGYLNISGDVIIGFDVKLSNNKVSNSSYFIMRILDKNYNVVQEETFIVPKSLDVGKTIPYQFKVNLNSDGGMIELFPDGDDISNNLQFRLTYIK